MTYLLDVNVLIALLDPAHVRHADAHQWFETEGRENWASCPIVQNGVARIMGNPRYPGGPGSPTTIFPLLKAWVSSEGHSFWSDDLSLMTSSAVDLAEIRTASQITDTYLLALAAARKGRLATFDRRLAPQAVRGGKAVLHVID